jgi:hypothetical protein
MIIIATTNKYSKHELSKKKLEEAKEFFLTHQDKWYNTNDLVIELDYKMIRIIINKLRVEGMPIISHNRFGYKYTTDKADIRTCYESLRNRLLIGLTAARRLRKFL